MRLLSTACTAGLTLGLLACDGTPQPLVETRHPTGSAALTSAAGFDALYVVHSDEETVARLGLEGQLQELDLPGQPTRVARAQDRVFVTLRGAGEVAVLIDEAGALRPVRTIAVGKEPFGVVTSEDGRFAYVASALSGEVDEIDTATLEVTRTWSVPDEPRWLALHPGGTLYVGSAWQGTLTYIDLGSGDVHESRLPERQTFEFETGDELPLARRITGDMAVSPDGRFLVVPAIYLDNQNPIEVSEQPGEPPRVPGGGGGYSSDRFNPVVAIIPVSGSGKPKMGDADLVPTNTFSREPNAGYVASAAVDPSSTVVLATIEGAASATALPLEVPERGGGIFDNFGDDGGFDTFDFRQSMVVSTAAGPRAVTFMGDDVAFTFSFLDRTVQRFDIAPARRPFELSEDGGRFVEPPRTDGIPPRAAFISSSRVLPDDVEAGRRLFYTSKDSAMSAEGSGVSCALCHFDGRTDGITWNFSTGARQTPSLAGPVSLTEPVRWEGDRATVAEDARFTNRSLMGGSGVDEPALAAIAAFIDWTPDVDSPLRGSNDPAVARGEALFNRADVGCASCHAGARYTDNQSYSMFGMPVVQTRSLVGLAGSPPYLHDGSAASLRELLERVRDGEMGDTSALDDDQLDDLEAYLRSL